MKIVYDRAYWHFAGEYPEDLPLENGGTHIGMFLAWAINNNLESDIHKRESQASLSAVRNKEMTGRAFLIRECAEKFWEDDLSEEGNAFALYYYESDMYFSDYKSALAGEMPSIYHVEDNWENYAIIAPVISKRYARWKKIRSMKWWEFWKYL